MTPIILRRNSELIMISIIIPVYNEEKIIKQLLNSFIFDNTFEVILVDGASTDRTKEIASQFPVKIIETAKGRAIQMNRGAKVAKGDIFLFLHSDCLLRYKSIKAIENCLSNGYIGGCLSQRINSNKFIFRLIENSGNIRARLSKVFYGDQAIFVRKDVFFEIGGFPEVPIMEDVLFSKKLREMGKTKVLPDKVLASVRRWDKRGILRTTLLYNTIIILFRLGYPLEKIKLLYDDLR